MNQVNQEGDQLLRVAESIKGNADDFWQKVEQIYEELEVNLGETYDANKAWWGPKSGVFLQNAKNIKPNFENAKNAINTMAQNLEDQVNSWASFEA